MALIVKASPGAIIRHYKGLQKKASAEKKKKEAIKREKEAAREQVKGARLQRRYGTPSSHTHSSQLTHSQTDSTTTSTRQRFKPVRDRIPARGTASDLDTKGRRGGNKPVTKLKKSAPKEQEAAPDNSKSADTEPKLIAGIKKAAQKTKDIFSRVFSFITGWAFALSAQMLLFRILIVLLVFSIVLLVLRVALGALANVLLETTVSESTLLNWTNPYQESLKVDSYVDDDGSYRTVISKVSNSDNGGGSGGSGSGSGGSGGGTGGGSKPIITETTDVELWCNLTDEQIETYILSKGTQYIDLDTYCKTYNIFRAIRMAYRICYAEDSNGKRYLDCEPEVLLGIPQFEKGFAWMGAASAYAWYYPDGSSGIQTASKDSISNDIGLIKTRRNVDNCASAIFDKRDDNINWQDGPYSFTYSGMSRCRDDFRGDFANFFGKDKTYNPLYASLLSSYTEYSVFKQYLAPDGTAISDDKDIFINYLFPSMLMTAVKYTKDYSGARVSSAYENNDSSYFWETVAPKIAEGTLADTSNLASRYDNNIIFFLHCVYNKITDKTDPSELQGEARTLYNAYRKQTILGLYYNFHHIPYFESVYDGVVFDTNPLTTNANSTYTGYDWYACQCFLTYEAVYQASGNLANLDSSAYKGDCTDATIVNTKWYPTNGKDVMTAYKGGVGGEWMSYYDYKTKTHYGYTDHGYYDNGVDDLLDMIAQKTFSGSSYNPFYNAATNSTLDASLWHEIQTNGTYPDALELNLKPLSIAANFYEGYAYQWGNLHAMSIEGLMAYITGSDLVESCLGVLLTNSGGSSGGSSSDEPIQTSNGLIYGPMLSSLLSDDIKDKMTSVELKGIGGVRDDNGKLTGDKQHLILPLVDMNKSKEGVQSTSGVNLYLNVGEGSYGADSRGYDYSPHGGIDITGTGNSASVESYFANTSNAWTQDLKTVASGVNALAETDIYTQGSRTPVVAMADGVITRIDYGYTGSVLSWDEETGTYIGSWTSYGNCIYMTYAINLNGKPLKEQSVPIVYAHLSPDFLAIIADSLGYSSQAEFLEAQGYSDSSSTKLLGLNIPIKQGTILGYAGNTGSSTGAHFHWGTSDYSMKILRHEATVDNPQGGKSCMMMFGRLAYGVYSSVSTDFTTIDKATYYPLSETWLTCMTNSEALCTRLGIASPKTNSKFDWDLKNLINLIKNTS